MEFTDLVRTLETGATADADNKDTRQRIIEAALALEQPGTADGLTLKKLAELLDLHYTALYYHFSNIDDLRAAVVEHLVARRSRHLQSAAAGAATALECVLSFIELELHEPPTRLLTTIASRQIAGDAGDRARGAITSQEQELARVIEAGMADGSIRDCDPAVVAHLISHIMGRYANQHEHVFEHAHFTSDFLTETVAEFVKHGIAAAGVDESVLGRSPLAELGPMAPPTGSNLDEILQTLSEYFERYGYRGTSIPDAAKSLGLSKTSLYKYAASKEELLFLCVQRSMSLVAQSRQLAVAVTSNPLAALMHTVYYDRFLYTHAPGPCVGPALFDSLTSEHAEVARGLYLERRWQTIHLLEECAEHGMARSFDARAVQPMIGAARLPLPPDDPTTGYNDDIAQFILWGIARSGG